MCTSLRDGYTSNKNITCTSNQFLINTSVRIKIEIIEKQMIVHTKR